MNWAAVMENPSTATVREDTIFDVGVLNVLVDACCDTDLYESDEETRPSPELLKQAAAVLDSLPIAHAEIAPYFGEIDVTWKRHNRRVKAIFGPSATSFSVYCEEMQNGRTVTNRLRTNADKQSLCESIKWLLQP
jgi:hypothetical protein